MFKPEVVQGGGSTSMSDQTVNYHMDGGGVKYGVTVNNIFHTESIEPNGHMGLVEIYDRLIWVGRGPGQDDPMTEEWYQLTDEMAEAIKDEAPDTV